MANVDNLTIKLTADATKAAAAIDDLTRSLQRLKGVSLPTALQDLSKNMTDAAKGAEQTAKSIGKLGTASQSAVSSIAGLGGKLLAFFGASYSLRETISLSMEYVENVNLFTVAMGNFASEAMDYAEVVSEVMGIDPSEWIRFQGVFMTLLTGFGNAEDRAYKMSKNLTQLAYDISSFYNIDFGEAFTKLQSGMSGELEPLRRLGWDLSEAQLNAVALELGLNRTVQEMTQAEKAELRYYAILNQVTTAQGDMGRTLINPANQMRILQANVTQAARAIGNILIPVMNRILPIFIAFAQVVRDAAQSIAYLFGYEIPEIDYSGVNYGANAAEDLGDNLDNAAGKAKELKKQLLGFDQINNITDNKKGGRGNDNLIGGGLGFDLPEYDFLGDAVAMQLEKVKNSIRQIGNAIKGLAMVKLISQIAGIGGKLGDVGAGLSLIVESKFPKVFSWFSKISTVGSKLFSVFSKFGAVFSKISATFKVFGKAIPVVGEVLMVLDVIKGVSSAIEYFNADAYQAVDVLSLLSASSRAMAEDTVRNIEDAFSMLKELDITDAIITQEDVDKVNGLMSEIVNSAEQNLDSQMNENLSNIRILGAAVGMAEEDVARLEQLFIDAANVGKSNLEKAQQEIVSIHMKAAQENRDLTEEEASQISDLETYIAGVYLDTVGATQSEISAITDEFVHGQTEKAAEMASSIIKSAIEERDAVIQAAKDKKASMIDTIEYMKAAGEIEEGTYRAMLDVAESYYYDEVDLANKAYAEIMDEMQEYFPWMSTYIDTETGEMKDNWDVFWEQWTIGAERAEEETLLAYTDMTGAMVDATASMESSIGASLGGVIASWQTMKRSIESNPVNGSIRYSNSVNVAQGIKGYASGGIIQTGEIFVAREAGAEMVGTIGNHTAVANNDQIVAGIASGVASANNQQNAILREQNGLLKALLGKDTGVYLDGMQLASSINRASRAQGCQLVMV